MRPLYHLWAAGKSRVQSHRLKIYIFIGWMNNFGHSPKKIMFAFRRLKKMFRRKCFFRVFFDQLLLNGNQYRDLFCRTTATTTTTTATSIDINLRRRKKIRQFFLLIECYDASTHIQAWTRAHTRTRIYPHTHIDTRTSSHRRFKVDTIEQKQLTIPELDVGKYK